MTTLKFKDGMEFNTSGALRIDQRSDGFYVIGQGYLIPAKDRKDAQETIKKLKRQGKHRL